MVTDVKAKNAKPQNRPYKLMDGYGLFLHVMPGGTKSWRYSFRFNGKAQTLTLGRYPAVSIREARKRRERARALLEDGINPILDAKKKKAQKKGKTFELIALEWWDTQKDGWSKAHADAVLKSLQKEAFPALGKFNVDEITPLQVLEVLKAVESRGALEMARKVKQRLAAVFRFAVQTGRAKYNPAADMKGVIKARKVKHMPALPIEEMPLFLRTLSIIRIHVTTKLALRFLILTAARNGEVRGATWGEIDREKREWRIPAERMKMDREHIVPLSRQALAVLDEASRLSGDSGLIFPGIRQEATMLSENTLQYALNRMGYKGVATVHGFRTVFSTYCNEAGKWNPDAIERALAHQDRNSIRAAYNRGAYLEERKKLMQWWANEIDRMEHGAEVVPLKRVAR